MCVTHTNTTTTHSGEGSRRTVNIDTCKALKLGGQHDKQGSMCPIHGFVPPTVLTSATPAPSILSDSRCMHGLRIPNSKSVHILKYLESHGRVETFKLLTSCEPHDVAYFFHDDDWKIHCAFEMKAMEGRCPKPTKKQKASSRFNPTVNIWFEALENSRKVDPKEPGMDELTMHHHVLMMLMKAWQLRNVQREKGIVWVTPLVIGEELARLLRDRNTKLSFDRRNLGIYCNPSTIELPLLLSLLLECLLPGQKAIFVLAYEYPADRHCGICVFSVDQPHQLLVVSTSGDSRLSARKRKMVTPLPLPTLWKNGAKPFKVAFTGSHAYFANSDKAPSIINLQQALSGGKFKLRTASGLVPLYGGEQCCGTSIPVVVACLLVVSSSVDLVREVFRVTMDWVTFQWGASLSHDYLSRLKMGMFGEDLIGRLCLWATHCKSRRAVQFSGSSESSSAIRLLGTHLTLCQHPLSSTSVSLRQVMRKPCMIGRRKYQGYGHTTVFRLNFMGTTKTVTSRRTDQTHRTRRVSSLG